MSAAATASVHGASAPPCAAGSTPLALARAGLDSCVHCGFCLQACPTYLALEDENDSPRGRLVLMRAVVEGRIAIDDPDVATHLSRCLGCRGCESACPSGVPYGHLLEAAREQLAAVRPLPLAARAILWVFARQAALRVALWFARMARDTGIAAELARLPGAAGFPFAMLASTARPAAPAWTPRAAPTRGTVATLDGCVMEGLFTEVNRATERVLAHNGYSVCAAPGQQCCGALHVHAGDADTARNMARTNIAAFEASGATFVAANSAGCGAMMKEYGQLLAADPHWRDRARAFSARVRDASELLAAAGPREGAPLPLRITCDAPCHLEHAQKLSAPPLQVLDAIPELQHTPLEDREQCCGSAGIFNLIEPDVSERVLAAKMRCIAATDAPVVATGNPGCLMQIGAGLVRDGRGAVARHPVELLDASYAQQDR
ncbi:MAG: heterodisulfide reductase-related iron-sulfur binding cluster [Gemmatimonadota bacterium]|nr:heterodisulfide reductase-related iron-sulfur binding cluster [Gemmatimonadota bacterium]